MKILLVDDHESTAKMMLMYLNALPEKYQVTVANNGKNGLKKILSKNFDYTLLDLSMPEFDGYYMLDHLEKENIIKDQNIIILTALNITDNEINQLKARGVYECFRKPVELKKIIAVLK